MKVAVNGFDMNYKVEGPADAPWLTFANSLVTSLEMWDEQARALKDRYRILRYDMRGHGQSGTPSPPYTLAALASDVLALWGALEVDRSHFVGLSLGGMIGIHLAARRPEKFRCLVATDCRADANEAYQGVFVERIRVTREQGMAGMVEPTLARFFTPVFAAAHPKVIEQFRQMIRSTAPDGHIGCCEALRGLAEGGNLPKITVPTLYMGGEHDIGAPPDMMRAMAEATPGARYVMLAGAGHISNIEAPDRYLAAIEPFLAAH
jgi:3-oxoadipate enol-lactonase